MVDAYILLPRGTKALAVTKVSLNLRASRPKPTPARLQLVLDGFGRIGRHLPAGVFAPAKIVACCLSLVAVRTVSEQCPDHCPTRVRTEIRFLVFSFFNLVTEQCPDHCPTADT